MCVPPQSPLLDSAMVYKTALVTAVCGGLLETKVLTKLLPSLFKSSSVAGLPKAAGITLGLLAGSAFWLG